MIVDSGRDWRTGTARTPSGPASQASASTDTSTFDRYTLVLLLRAVDAPDLPEEELDALQEKHLAFLRSMRECGVLAAAGPFTDRRDERLRGLCIYVTDAEEARRLAAQDPAVVAGRMTPEIVTWLVPPGEVALTRV